MQVLLKNYTDLSVLPYSIRMCWDSFHKQDTKVNKKRLCKKCLNEKEDNDFCERCDKETKTLIIKDVVVGDADKELINRVCNKYKHNSLLEFLDYTFEIRDLSTKALLELTRHRIGTSYAVMSSRYTLKKNIDKISYSKSKNEAVNKLLEKYFAMIQDFIKDNHNIGNDDLSLLLPQAYNYNLMFKINGRSLQNFLTLRTNKSAHYHIRELAYQIYDKLPDEHKFIYKDFVYQEDKNENS